MSRIPIGVNAFVVIFICLLNFNVFNIPEPDSSFLTYRDRFSYASYEIMHTFVITIFALICYRFRFCIHNWISVFNLYWLNIVNLIAIFTPLNLWTYYFWQLTGLAVFFTCVSIILFLIKLKKKQNTIYRNPKTKQNDTR